MQTEQVSVQKIFELAQRLSPIDQRSLAAMLNLRFDAGLPEEATIDEAINLYLADKCSLGRAAELANVTRWELIEVLKQRKISVTIETDFTAAEMDEIAAELEREGLLC